MDLGIIFGKREVIHQFRLIIEIAVLFKVNLSVKLLFIEDDFTENQLFMVTMEIVDVYIGRILFEM